jgi:hypothetical protein
MSNLQRIIFGIMCINVAILYYLVLTLMSQVRDLKDRPRRRS